jgi:hypothetical protein
MGFAVEFLKFLIGYAWVGFLLSVLFAAISPDFASWAPSNSFGAHLWLYVTTFVGRVYGDAAFVPGVSTLGSVFCSILAVMGYLAPILSASHAIQRFDINKVMGFFPPQGILLLWVLCCIFVSLVSLLYWLGATGGDGGRHEGAHFDSIFYECFMTFHGVTFGHVGGYDNNWARVALSICSVAGYVFPVYAYALLLGEGASRHCCGCHNDLRKSGDVIKSTVVKAIISIFFVMYAICFVVALLAAGSLGEKDALGNEQACDDDGVACTFRDYLWLMTATLNLRVFGDIVTVADVPDLAVCAVCWLGFILPALAALAAAGWHNLTRTVWHAGAILLMLVAAAFVLVASFAGMYHAALDDNVGGAPSYASAFTLAMLDFHAGTGSGQGGKFSEWRPRLALCVLGVLGYFFYPIWIAALTSYGTAEWDHQCKCGYWDDDDVERGATSDGEDRTEALEPYPKDGEAKTSDHRNGVGNAKPEAESPRAEGKQVAIEMVTSAPIAASSPVAQASSPPRSPGRPKESPRKDPRFDDDGARAMGWERGVCPVSGRPYWYNEATDESLWEDPCKVKKEAKEAKVPVSKILKKKSYAGPPEHLKSLTEGLGDRQKRLAAIKKANTMLAQDPSPAKPAGQTTKLTGIAALRAQLRGERARDADVAGLTNKVKANAYTAAESRRKLRDSIVAIEEPKGTEDMGGWTMRVYTAEQCARLGIDKHGKPAGETGKL